MKMKFRFVVVLFTSINTWAQTPVSSQAQVAQARDFVGSVINRISSSGASQYPVSKDYAVTGPMIQARFTRALTEFKQMMDLVARGPFGAAVEQYNQLVRDTSISTAEKGSRLEAMYQSLVAQSKILEMTNQNALKLLYEVEPKWLIQSIEKFTNRTVQTHWLDGFNWELDGRGCFMAFEKYPLSASPSYRTACDTVVDNVVQAAILQRIKDTIAGMCKTQACYSSVISSYSSYFNDVTQLLNQPVMVTFADGKQIKLNALTSSAEWGRYRVLTQVLESFQFDESFLKLPLQN